MSPTDEAAMKRWTARRDADAFRILVQEHAGMVYATCKRILGNAAAAEDITQECFETLAGTKATTQIHALGPWLHGVATKRCLVHIRSEGRRRQREAKYVSEQDTQTEIQWSDIYDCIDEVVASLPGEVRDPLIAHYFYGDTHAEIARSDGIPRRTVSSRIQRGVESVGAALRDRGLTVSTTVLGGWLGTNLASAAPVSQSLTTALGKIALTYSGSATVASAATTFFAMKGTVALIGLMIVVAGAALTLLPRSEEPDPAPAVSQQGLEPDLSAADLPRPRVDTAAEAAGTQPSDTTPATAATLPVVAATAEGAVIEGRITFHGEPVPDQFVTGSPFRRAEPIFIATTDEEGYYRVGGLVPQELTIRAGLMFENGRLIRATERMERSRFQSIMAHSAIERVELESDQTLRLDFAFPVPKAEPPPNSGSLQGVVLVDGQVPEVCSISCYTADNRRSFSVDVEADGSYYRDSIPEGEFFVRLYVSRPPSERMEWWTRTSILTDRVTTLDIDVDRSHSGSIRGDIRGLRDGEQANVMAFKGDAYVPGTYSTTWLSEVDAPVAARTWYGSEREGYRMEHLAPGVYTVVAAITFRDRDGGVPHYGLLEHRVIQIVDGGEATVDFEFTAEDPPVIEGVLTGLHPEERGWVNVYRGTFPMPVPFDENSDPSEFIATQFQVSSGRDIQIWNLGPGTYSLWASVSPSGLVVGPKKTDWTVVTIPEHQEKPIHVELTPVIQKYKGTIRCHLENLRPGRPEVLAYALAGTQEVPLHATGSYWQEVHRERRGGRALDSDSVTLTGLDPGVYTVVAFHFPMRNMREVRDAAGISTADFYAATMIASANVEIKRSSEEVQLELSF